MQRRSFFKKTSLAVIGTTILGPFGSLAGIPTREALQKTGKGAKNIIFLVSDGMSIGTMSMANLLLQRKEGRTSEWMKLYEDRKVTRALMDTASASSLVTDSAAASSSWGGGVRVPNGSLNVNADGSENTPILQKFKAAGKAVGCVTTVPITHATPAGFCVSSKKRDNQEDIALQYHDLRFDVMMGAGDEYFNKEKRKDKRDVYRQLEESGFQVVKNRKQMQQMQPGKPVMGVFYETALPYSVDAAQDAGIREQVPTLAEMAGTAIDLMSRNKNGFVLQIEAGKVDWAAHGNDIAALLYDQVAFDEAIKLAVDFAEKDKETLVIITTDHGNANPGLFYGSDANRNFDHIRHFRHSNDWILNGINRNHSPARVAERIEAAQGLALTTAQAGELLSHYKNLDESGIYNPRKLPFRQLAQMQAAYTSVGWGGMDHSGDYVELAMYGPGSELLRPFVKNTELHNFMLELTGVVHQD